MSWLNSLGTVAHKVNAGGGKADFSLYDNTPLERTIDSGSGDGQEIDAARLVPSSPLVRPTLPEASLTRLEFYCGFRARPPQDVSPITVLILRKPLGSQEMAGLDEAAGPSKASDEVDDEDDPDKPALEITGEEVFDGECCYILGGKPGNWSGDDLKNGAELMGRWEAKTRILAQQGVSRGGIEKRETDKKLSCRKTESIGAKSSVPRQGKSISEENSTLMELKIRGLPWREIHRLFNETFP